MMLLVLSVMAQMIDSQAARVPQMPPPESPHTSPPSLPPSESPLLSSPSPLVSSPGTVGDPTTDPDIGRQLADGGVGSLPSSPPPAVAEAVAVVVAEAEAETARLAAEAAAKAEAETARLAAGAAAEAEAESARLAVKTVAQLGAETVRSSASTVGEPTTDSDIGRRLADAGAEAGDELTTDSDLGRQLADEGVGAGADRMAYGGQPVADMPDALSHLSNALDRRAATEGTEFVELKLLAVILPPPPTPDANPKNPSPSPSPNQDGQPVIMDSPIYLKYQDLYHRDLWEAAKTGDMARLKELLDEGHAIDERQDGATPMYWAQYYLQAEAMEYLLQRGADPNAKELVLLAAPHQRSSTDPPSDPFESCPVTDGGLLPTARCCIPQGGLHRLRQTTARCRGATRRALGDPPPLARQPAHCSPSTPPPHPTPTPHLTTLAVHDDAPGLCAMEESHRPGRSARDRGVGERADECHEVRRAKLIKWT